MTLKTISATMITSVDLENYCIDNNEGRKTAMCRQAIFSKPGVELIENEYGGIENFLQFLVRERGGDGNGIILVKNKKIINFYKGVNVTTEQIANTLKNEKYDWALFHTRNATVGEISDKNCHPFVFTKNFAMAMNGTLNGYTDGNLTDTKTDTERAAIDLYNSKKNPEKYLTPELGRCAFTGFYKGKPYLVCNNKKIIRILKTGDKTKIRKKDAFVIASDFPWEYDGKNIYDVVSERFCWKEGEKLDMDKLKKAETGKGCLMRGLYNELLNKSLDTLISHLAVRMNKREAEFNEYTFEQIIELGKEKGIIDENHQKVQYI